jgi:SAM-dependent methyltransferase
MVLWASGEQSIKVILKKTFGLLGISHRTIAERIAKWSLIKALRQNGLYPIIEKLEAIVPDISDQYSREHEFNAYWNLNVRGMHAFQTSLMMDVITSIVKNKITVVDIGDSSGTHMLYLKNLIEDKIVDTISVNLDRKAIDKIRAKGLRAILCRAEDLAIEDNEVDLFTSFEMVEHLHNPAIFFHRLAQRSLCNKLLITVPYLRQSRVGLQHVRNRSTEPVFAEEEHIFELSPNDWNLLLLHSGWKVTYSKIYFQYPKRWPIMSNLLARFWRMTDFEGFWGALLEKDTSFSDRYQDWES